MAIERVIQIIYQAHLESLQETTMLQVLGSLLNLPFM